jgi:hypothetical protein
MYDVEVRTVRNEGDQIIIRRFLAQGVASKHKKSRRQELDNIPF